MKILFYEPDHSGHHFPYLARMLPGFIGDCFELCLATTPGALASDQYERFLKPFENQLRIYDDCSTFRGTPLRIGAFRAKEIRQLVAMHKPDHTFVAYADGIWQIIALRSLFGLKFPGGNSTLEGILYRGGFTYPSSNSASNRFKRFLFRSMCSKGVFDRLLLDDEYLYDYASEIADKSKTILELAVNPIEIFTISRESARKDLGLDRDAYVISLSGMIDERKGADLLIKAFVALVTNNERKVVLLLGGPHNHSIKKLLSETLSKSLHKSGRIVSLDRLLGEVDMYKIAVASDLVTAPYPNHSGRSSIILWAAAAGRPVLGTNRGCVARVIESERLGWTCDVSNPLSLELQLAMAAESKWSKVDERRSIEYARQHTVENYRLLNARFVRSLR